MFGSYGARLNTGAIVPACTRVPAVCWAVRYFGLKYQGKYKQLWFAVGESVHCVIDLLASPALAGPHLAQAWGTTSLSCKEGGGSRCCYGGPCSNCPQMPSTYGGWIALVQSCLQHCAISACLLHARSKLFLWHICPRNEHITPYI